MQANKIADVLRRAVGELGRIDQEIAAALKATTPEALGAEFKKILVEQMKVALDDKTGLERRRVKIQMIYIIERCSEKLQDLIETDGMTDGSKYMYFIERAIRFATKIASLKDGSGSKSLIQNYERHIVPVSILDPLSPEDKASRRQVVRDSFGDFMQRGV